VINRDAHVAKCADEAKYRGEARKANGEPAPVILTTSP
jgi:hypothetical protein